MNENLKWDCLKVFIGFVMLTLLLTLAGCGSPNIEQLKEQENYSRIIDILTDRDQDPSVRIEAAKALGYSDDKETVDALLEGFTISALEIRGTTLEEWRRNTYVLRNACLDSLIQIGNRDVVRGLIDVAFRKPWGSETLVVMAKDALVEIGKPTLDVIEESYLTTISSEVLNYGGTLTSLCIRLADEDPFELFSKAWIFSCPLSISGKSSSCNSYYEEVILPLVGPEKIDSGALISFLKGDDPDLRQVAAYTLRYVKGVEVTDALLDACQDDDLEMRYLATTSLIYVNPQKGTEILADFIQEYGQDESDFLVKVILDSDPVPSEIDDEDYAQIVDFLIGLFNSTGSSKKAQ